MLKRPPLLPPGPTGLQALVSRGLLLALLFGGCAAERAEMPASLDEMRGRVVEQFPRVPQLSTAALAAWLDDPSRPPPVLVDVRAAAEYEVSHLPGALRAESAAELALALDALPPGRALVLYCSVGWRSSRLADELRALQPAREIHNLDGSIFQWAGEGRPLAGPGGAPTARVHPYDAQWGRLLAPALRAPLP